MTPALVLNSWSNDRFVKPSPISPLDFLAVDLLAFETASGFEPIELSPVCPLGTNTAVAPMSQNKVLGTIRNTEVVADSTNVMALECANRRKHFLRSDPKSSALVKLSSSHRLVRTQKFLMPNATAHFKVFSLCTAGRDSGHFGFEADGMSEHIGVWCRLLKSLGSRGFDVQNIRVVLFCEDTFLESRVSAAIKSEIAGVKLEISEQRKSKYYPTISFKLNATNYEGVELELADGGLTDWTQKFVGSSKERLMISGIGMDRLISKFKIPKSNTEKSSNRSL